MKPWLAIVLLLAFNAEAGIDFDTDFHPQAVINGIKVQKGDPITLSTVAIDTGSGFCTGSLITNDVVVTAAHCVKRRPRAESPAR